MEDEIGDLTLLACVVFAFGIVSRRLDSTVRTALTVFVLAGVVLGPAGLDLVEIGRDSRVGRRERRKATRNAAAPRHKVRRNQEVEP